VSEEAARLEICESRRKLESQLQKPVRTFSFPHGEFNDSIIAQCRKAGYERTFSTSPELLRDGSAKFVVGRVAADPWDWTLEFKLKMYGAYSWQFYLQSLKQNVKRVFVRKNEADLDPRHHAEHPLDVQQTHTPKNT
jgi:hypothetical protein